MSCREHLAQLREHEQELDRLGAVVLRVSFEEPSVITRFTEGESLPYPILSDPERRAPIEATAMVEFERALVQEPGRCLAMQWTDPERPSRVTALPVLSEDMSAQVQDLEGRQQQMERIGRCWRPAGRTCTQATLSRCTGGARLRPPVQQRACRTERPSR